MANQEISQEANKAELLGKLITEAKRATDLEISLPENTLENPQPTVFKVLDADLQAHKTYYQSFPVNKDIPQPVIPDFVNKEAKNAANDDYEYILKDEKGEAKVTENGFLLGGRKYLFSTFTLPGRGRKLYALAAEAAKAVGIRDAFVLFLKNKKLYRDTTTDKERTFLEQSGFNVTRTKNRPTSVVSARALFVHYGARVICQGKRVVDDYWEEEAIKQGFKPEDQVFPVDRKYYPRNPDKSKRAIADPKQLIFQNKLLVTPLPSIEDRQEYLISSSNGSVSQILPGQGISGGLELASLATLPKYRSDATSTTRHKSILSSLVTDTKVQSAPVAQATNQVPIDDNLAGIKSPKGLPYYEKSITRRIALEDADKLHEIEYLHGTLETNNFISIARKQRNRQWGYYWQVKSGTRLGLTKEEAGEFLQEQQDSLNEIQKETVFNEQLQREQIVTKRRRPNPNFLGYGNLKGLKAPYTDRPKQEASQEQKEHNQTQGLIGGQHIPGQTAGPYPPHLVQHISQQNAPY